MAQREAERQARYDKTVRLERDARYTTFYHSGVWEDKRRYIISLYSGIDVYAYYAKGKSISATMVHHITELKEDWSLRLADSNLIPLSDASHREMARLYRNNKASTQKLLRGFLLNWHKEYPRGWSIKF